MIFFVNIFFAILLFIFMMNKVAITPIIVLFFLVLVLIKALILSRSKVIVNDNKMHDVMLKYSWLGMSFLLTGLFALFFVKPPLFDVAYLIGMVFMYFSLEAIDFIHFKYNNILYTIGYGILTIPLVLFLFQPDWKLLITDGSTNYFWVLVGMGVGISTFIIGLNQLRKVVKK